MRKSSNILSAALLALCVLFSGNVAAQSSQDYINKTKRHLYALNDSISKYCRDSVNLQKELDKLPKSSVGELTTRLNNCVNDTISLTSKLKSNSILLDSMSLKHAALNDSLALKLKRFTNDLLNAPCNPEAIKSLASYKSYPVLKGNAQLEKNIQLLNAYEAYSTQLLSLVMPVYETIDRNGWQPLGNKSEVLNKFSKGLSDFKKKVYKDYGKENSNIPILDRTIDNLEKLRDNMFGGSKETMEAIIQNLTPTSYHLESPVEMLTVYKAQIDSLNQLNSTGTESLNSMRSEIDKLQRDIESSGAGKRVSLEQKLKAIHVKCDDWREEKDIAIFKECLFINLKQPYNDTIITALRHFATETYFKSYKDFQEPYLHILDNYGAYTDALYNVMRDCYNEYCRKAGWQRLPDDLINNVRKRLTSQEYYKLYYVRKDKVNSPHLNGIISEYLKLMNTGFSDCKTQYLELLTKLRGKVPKKRSASSENKN